MAQKNLKFSYFREKDCVTHRIIFRRADFGAGEWLSTDGNNFPLRYFVSSEYVLRSAESHLLDSFTVAFNDDTLYFHLHKHEAQNYLLLFSQRKIK